MINSARVAYAAALFAAAAHGAATGQPSKAPLPSELGMRLVDQRAMEIKQGHAGDADARAATDALAALLKGNPTVQETIPIVCPPSPAPAPTGMTAAIASAKNWETRIPVEVDRAQNALVVGTQLTQAQKLILLKHVAPDFKKPGSPTKFELISAPACPGPAPAPKGFGK